MAVLQTVGRNAAVAAVGALLNNNGTIKFVSTPGGTGASEVATCTFGATAFGDPATGVITANAITSDPHATGGTIHNGTGANGGVILCKFDTTPVMVCEAAASGSEFNGVLTITALDIVAVTAMTLTQPA